MSGRRGSRIQAWRWAAGALCALALVSCGGGGDGEGDAAEVSPEATTASSSAEAVATTTPPPITAAPTTVPVAVPDDGTVTEAWAEWSEAAPTPPSATEDPGESLVAYFSAVIDQVHGDPRRLSGQAAGDLSVRSIVRADLRGQLAVVGESMTMGVDLFALTTTHAEVHAASSNPDLQAFWAQRAQAATAFLDANRTGVEVTAGLVGAPIDEIHCFMGEVTNQDCGDSVEASTLLNAFGTARDAYREADVDDVGFELRGITGVRPLPNEPDVVCAAWDEAFAAAGLDEAGRTDVFFALDDTLLDSHFLGLSECAWVETREEDAEVSFDADSEIHAEYARRVVAVAAASGYDDAVDDLGGGTDEEREEFRRIQQSASFAIVAEAIRAASELRAGARHPNTYLFFTGVAALTDEPIEFLEDDSLGAIDIDDLEEGLCPAIESAVDELGPDAALAAFALDNLRSVDAVVPSCSFREADSSTSD